MPLYQWKCPDHGEFEATYKMDTKPDTAPCPVCNAGSRQVVCIGGVQGDEMPAWFQHPHARGCLQSAGERPIETRTEYRKYLKDHNIGEYSAVREI